ncbi:hypothetical protein JT119_08080 [Helicobacter pylori]|nr:hypothetical protein [Helicobacter phage Pt5771G]MCQ2830528.1 hypothetical protein [Helicobacter pylori]
MRQEHETATSFNQLKAITQAVMLKKDLQENATHQESDRTQEANNANAKARTQEPTQKTTLKPKASVKAKKGALKPTKRAFSERQRTAFRNNSHASNKSQETKQANQQGDNANAFKTDQANNQENQKGGNNEA